MADETEQKKVMASWRLDPALLDRLTAAWRARVRNTPSTKDLPTRVDLVSEALTEYLTRDEKKRAKMTEGS